MNIFPQTSPCNHKVDTVIHTRLHKSVYHHYQHAIFKEVSGSWDSKECGLPTMARVYKEGKRASNCWKAVFVVQRSPEVLLYSSYDNTLSNCSTNIYRTVNNNCTLCYKKKAGILESDTLFFLLSTLTMTMVGYKWLNSRRVSAVPVYKLLLYMLKSLHAHNRKILLLNLMGSINYYC